VTSGSLRLKALAALNYDLFRHPDMSPAAPATLYTRIAADAASAFARVPEITSSAEPIDLPSEADLYRLYDEYNWLYFGGKLPAARIEYSTRMTSAGSFSARERLIRIGRKYHELYPEEIADTLKHEMLHFLYPTHGAAFGKEAARIGATVRAKHHPSLCRPPKYVYACPGCGKRYPRQKRLRMASCGDCSKSGFDPRFKLSRDRSGTTA
jgi:predicted SprT family Zn-dependent metalloprotease